MMRLDWLGVNVGYDPVYSPGQIAAAGFNSLAIVAMKQTDLTGYVRDCERVGVVPCLCIAGGSLDGFASVEEAAAHYASRYPTVRVWTLLNEADGQREVHDDGSWVMDDDEASRILRVFTRRFPRDVHLYAIGTVTGQPSYFNDPDGPGVLDLAGCDGLDNHAYAQWPNTVWSMLGNYDAIDARFGLRERVIREFGWPHPDPAERGKYIAGMVRAIEDGNDQRQREGKSVVRGMWVYCWADEQHVKPFHVNDPACLAHVRTLAYAPGSTPSPPVFNPNPHDFWIGTGLTAVLRTRRLVALSGEGYFNAGTSSVLVAQEDGTRRLLFWSSTDGRAWLGPSLEAA
jgi:hypothetical protein